MQTPDLAPNKAGPGIWAVSDGRRGIENQALGLAERLAGLVGGSVRSHHVRSHDVFEALPPVLQIALKGTPSKFGLPEPLPAVAVGCGRQAIAPLVALRRAGVRTVYVQAPRVDPGLFDLVVAPEHDALQGPNVVSMLGSPNRVTEAWLARARAEFGGDLAALPRPRAAILVGGDSKRHTMSADAATVHLAAARGLLAQGYSLLVTLSRRTPDEVVPMWASLRGPRVWLHDGRSSTRNPYPSFLVGADVILVTEDSTNMLVEACATGRPVFRLPMEGKPGKFAALYSALRERCGVRLWDGVVGRGVVGDGAVEGAGGYEPLDETSRVAAVVASRLGLERALGSGVDEWHS